MDATLGLPDLLEQIPDPRRAEGKRHPLRAVLSLLVLATWPACCGLQGVVDFGRNLPPDVVESLGFTRSKTLAKSTLSEILRAIDVDAFEAAVGRWLRRQADHHGWTAIAIDGKSLRGATGEQLPAVHLVAAYAHEAQVVLAELRVDAKTDEHKAALELLGLLPLKGAIVTADAMFTTPISAGKSATAAAITSWPSRRTNRRCSATSRPSSPRTRAVPPYQRRLREAARTRATAIDKGHGRRERRDGDRVDGIDDLSAAHLERSGAGLSDHEGTSGGQ